MSIVTRVDDDNSPTSSISNKPASETPKMYAFDGWTMNTYTTSKMVCRSYKQIV